MEIKVLIASIYKKNFNTVYCWLKPQASCLLNFKRLSETEHNSLSWVCCPFTIFHLIQIKALVSMFSNHSYKNSCNDSTQNALNNSLIYYFLLLNWYQADKQSIILVYLSQRDSTKIVVFMVRGLDIMMVLGYRFLGYMVKIHAVIFYTCKFFKQHFVHFIFSLKFVQIKGQKGGYIYR